jgi:hypothetical protein
MRCPANSASIARICTGLSGPLCMSYPGKF